MKVARPVKQVGSARVKCIQTSRASNPYVGPDGGSTGRAGSAWVERDARQKLLRYF